MLLNLIFNNMFSLLLMFSKIIHFRILRIINDKVFLSQLIYFVKTKVFKKIFKISYFRLAVTPAGKLIFTNEFASSNVLETIIKIRL